MTVRCIHCDTATAYPRQWRAPGVRVSGRERYRCPDCGGTFSERQHRIDSDGSAFSIQEQTPP